MCEGSLVSRPLKRPENEASVCGAAVAVMTKCVHTVIVASRGIQDIAIRLAHGMVGVDTTYAHMSQQPQLHRTH